MATLYANPYARGYCRGFYFTDADEFDAEYQKQEHVDGDAFGRKCEEYEIMFIDGDVLASTLFKSMSVTQGTVHEFYDRLEELEELEDHELAVLFFLLQYKGYGLEAAVEKIPDALLGAGRASDAAYDFFDDLGGVEILSDEDLALHLDYHGLGVALYSEGIGAPEQTETEIAYEWLEQYGPNTSDAPRQVLIDNFDMESWITDAAANGDLRQIEYDGETYTLFNAATI